MCSEGAIIDMQKVSKFRIIKKGSMEKPTVKTGGMEVEEDKEIAEEQSTED